MTAPAIDYDDLRRREARLRAGGSTARMRDAADALGVPEAALVEARRESGAAVRLALPDTPEGVGALVARLAAVGEAMALTRNDHCVHERHGRYAAPCIHGAMGQVVGEIDLRVFTKHWAFAYALTEQTHKTARRSIQVFDEAGTAVHKVYPTDATDIDAFDALIADNVHVDASPAAFAPPPEPEHARPDAEIDASSLREDWAALEHSNDFTQLLRKHGVTRAQAMRLGGPELARPVSPAAAQAVLDLAAGGAIPLMIVVGNRGCVQIHSGPVETIKVTGPWLNVLDPRFNLHVRWDRIAAAFVVRKPSLRGGVHALELYDADGFCFCQIFGERKPGECERADWRAMIAKLEAVASC